MPHGWCNSSMCLIPKFDIMVSRKASHSGSPSISTVGGASVCCAPGKNTNLKDFMPWFIQRKCNPCTGFSCKTCARASLSQAKSWRFLLCLLPVLAGAIVFVVVVSASSDDWVLLLTINLGEGDFVVVSFRSLLLLLLECEKTKLFRAWSNRGDNIPKERETNPTRIHSGLLQLVRLTGATTFLDFAWEATWHFFSFAFMFNTVTILPVVYVNRPAVIQERSTWCVTGRFSSVRTKVMTESVTRLTKTITPVLRLLHSQS